MKTRWYASNSTMNGRCTDVNYRNDIIQPRYNKMSPSTSTGNILLYSLVSYVQNNKLFQ